jgi:hypothetical protein
MPVCNLIPPDFGHQSTLIFSSAGRRAGAAVPAEGEASGAAEALPERPQAHLPQGPVRRRHVRRHPPRPGRLQLVPHRKQTWHAATSTTS